jgi:hypothetical protein
MLATVKTVSDAHLYDFQTEFVQGSGIHPDLYALSVSVVSDLEPDSAGDAQTPIHDALNWRYTRFGLQVQPSIQAALLLNEDGSCWQAKLSNPKQDSKSGKLRKYETPVGNGSRAFLPSLPIALQQQIAQQYSLSLQTENGSFWDWVADHPEIPIVLTEGGKKALSSLTQGSVTIALYGINAGVSKYETIGGEKLRRLHPELIPDLQRFAQPGRSWILAFDQDTAHQTRTKVAAALSDLAYHLGQTGGTVTIARWDGASGRCKGLDDLIVNAGPQAWRSAIDQAIPAHQWRIQYQIATQVKRSPNRSIGHREFTAVASELPRSGLVALYGGKGTGKSQAIREMLVDRHWLSFTPLVSLGRDQASSWNGVLINDGDVIGSQLLRDGQPVNGASVCIPSLLKVRQQDGEVLVLDELTATLEFLLGSKLANQNGMRPLLLEEFGRRVREAELVILADADLTEESIAYIEAIRCERAYLVKSSRKALTYSTTLIDGTQAQAIATLLERFKTLPSEQLIYINTDSKALADSLAKLLQREGLPNLLITSDTSGGELEVAFLTSQGMTLPSLIQRGIKAIITSPTVTQGFSIQSHADRIDSVWGLYKGGSITAHGMAQALDRVRSSQVPRLIHVAKKGSAFSKLSKAQGTTAFLKEFKQVSTTAAKLVRHGLTPTAIATIDALDWQSNNLKLLASLEVRRNRGMASLRDTLIALLEQEGKQTTVWKPKVSNGATRRANEGIKQAREQVNLAHCRAVAAAKPIDDTEAKQLSEQTTALSHNQVLSLTQWQLARFYRLQSVSAADVLFDRKGNTQTQIRNLEMALEHGRAIDRTSQTINQNPDSPQDWDKVIVRRWLMEQAGATQLIAQIVGGEVVDLFAEVTAPIAQFIRDHAPEFRLGFGFSKLEKMSNQQLVGILLATCGIRSIRSRRQGSYRVDLAGLELLKMVLRRRQESDPDLLKQDINRGVRILGGDSEKVVHFTEKGKRIAQISPVRQVDMRL